MITANQNLLQVYKNMDMNQRRQLRSQIINSMAICENSFYRFLYGQGKSHNRKVFRSLITQFITKPNTHFMTTEQIKQWLRDFLWLIYQENEFDLDTNFIDHYKMDQFDFMFMLRKAEVDLKCHGKLIQNAEAIRTVSDFINHALTR